MDTRKNPGELTSITVKQNNDDRVFFLFCVPSINLLLKYSFAGASSGEEAADGRNVMPSHLERHTCHLLRMSLAILNLTIERYMDS